MGNSKKVFLDANVLLEVLLDRKGNDTARRAITQNAGRLYVSALTAHLVVHFGQSVVSLPILRQFIADYYVVDLSEQDFEWAFINARSTDFEDALQIGTAIRAGCNEFYTLDKGLVKAYKDIPTIKVQLLG